MANPIIAAMKNAYLDWLVMEDTAAQQQVLTYRSYYEGDPPTQLTDRQAQFLNVARDKRFGANVCAPIVDTLVERLRVTGFDVRGKGETVTDAPKVLAALLDDWWSLNRMDAGQDVVHRAALRDREAFIIVSFDEKNNRPQLAYDFAYDGRSGVKVHMVPGTYNQVAFASKRWIVSQSKEGTYKRLNTYFPNRIEKWASFITPGNKHGEAFWQPYEKEEGLEMATCQDELGNEYMASVAWWTDDGTETGEPLGIPVIPFINRDDGTGAGLSEIDNAIPLQDGINKTYIDLMAAADMTGFGMYWTTGSPPLGGWKVYPGAMYEVAVAPGSTGAAMGTLPAGDLSGLINLLQTQVALLAGITGTPQSRFTPSAVRPAEGTQKQEEAALVAKARGLQKAWGNAWEDAMRMCIRVADAFAEGVTISDIGDLIISTAWADAEVRNELQHLEGVALKVERLEVPVQQAWTEAGYDASQVRAFERQRRNEQAAARLAALRAATKQPPTPEQAPEPTEPETEEEE